MGDIPGLSPRRRRGEGEVPAANVDLVDRLPRPPAGQEWPTVAAWLQSRNTVATRRGYLHCLAAFLRWLQIAVPGAGLWVVTEDVLVAYKDQILTGTGHAAQLLKGGRPLGASTAAQRVSALRSLYAYALRRHVIDYDPAVFVDPPETPRIGMTPALAEHEATDLMDGAEAIAGDHPLDAAAVALLLNIGLRTGELEAMPVSAFTWDGGHFVARFRVKGGKVLPVPVVPRVRLLVEPLLRGRADHEFLLQHPDGRPWNRGRVTTALRRAARAVDLRPGQLTPHVLRATVVTLLSAAGVPPNKIHELTGHASVATLQRYDHAGVQMDGHAAYLASGLLSRRR
ncbi:tyrosine-type recombinase/integrase [Actinomadura sp. NPDC048955]|uniref:tyrosine-type recombinase/integrase n=1 Tax=Actinomadura sp. NPDC048955 TaxID=3158228 RepID=UPI00340897E0